MPKIILCDNFHNRIMKTYEEIFREVQDIIVEGTGTQLHVSEHNISRTTEGARRESICQVLADQNDMLLTIRVLFSYPSLIVPYLFRIRSK